MSITLSQSTSPSPSSSTSSTIFDIRSLAEERLKSSSRKSYGHDQNSCINDYNNEYQRRKAFLRRRSVPIKLEIQSLMEVSLGKKGNETIDMAKLAEIDYKLNGSRCKAYDSNDFIGPRWIPDLECNTCKLCCTEFNWLNRRHHCRACGFIYCDKCSTFRLLLPKEYGLRDPQRVCELCSTDLIALQSNLTNDIANHLRSNSIDIVSGDCNIRRFFNLPYSNTLGSEIRKAAYSTHNLFTFIDRGIPVNLVMGARGLAFLTIVKGGFIFAPKFGTGLVVSRLADNSWSPPTAIALLGLSWGFLVGADITDYIIILNTNEAVKAFSGIGNISIGAGIDVAVGPVGRTAEAAVNVAPSNGINITPAFSYSYSKGLFAGVSLDGSIIMSRSEVNHRFYGHLVTPDDLLGGKVPQPRAAEPLYTALDSILRAAPNPVYECSSSSNSSPIKHMNVL